jgi:hypothetical protein
VNETVPREYNRAEGDAINSDTPGFVSAVQPHSVFSGVFAGQKRFRQEPV